MRVLIVGNADSIWIKKYCENVLLKRKNCAISVLSSKNSVFRDFYLNENIEILEYKQGKIPFFSSFFVSFSIKKKYRKRRFDYVHVHFCNMNNLRLGRLFVFNGTKLILTYWGSDLLRDSDFNIKRKTKYVKLSHKIVLLTKNMIDFFYQKYAFAKKMNNIFVFDFGSPNIDYLNRFSRDNVTSKKLLGISDNYQCIVTIGYNASDGQQQLEVINGLLKSNKIDFNNILFVFPLTYGSFSKEYGQKVLNAINSLPNALVLKDFMDEEQMSRLINATDVFINAQVSDALSATVLEFLFCEKMVINPSWLSYIELKELGVFDLKYDSFDSLAETLFEYMNNKDSYLDLQKNNKSAIWQSYSWEICFDNWDKLYEFDVNKD